MSASAVHLTHLFLSPGHDFFGRHGKGRAEHGILDQDHLELVAGSGIRGDRFFDYKPDYKGQITFFDHAIYEKVRSKFSLPDLDPGAFRRNVVVQGVSLPDLIGREFQIGGLRFSGSEESKPCYWMDQACAPGTEEFLRGNGGLRCRILNDGILKKGPQNLELL